MANELCSKNAWGENSCGKDVHSKDIYAQSTWNWYKQL